MEKTRKSESRVISVEMTGPPINSVHVRVWNCFCIKVQAMVTFLLINLKLKNCNTKHGLVSLLSASRILILETSEWEWAACHVFPWSEASSRWFPPN